MKKKTISYYLKNEESLVFVCKQVGSKQLWKDTWIDRMNSPFIIPFNPGSLIN